MAVNLAMRSERTQGRCRVYVGDGWPPTRLAPVRHWGERISGSPEPDACDLVSYLATGEIDRLLEMKGEVRRDPPSSITCPIGSTRPLNASAHTGGSTSASGAGHGAPGRSSLWSADLGDSLGDRSHRPRMAMESATRADGQ